MVLQASKAALVSADVAIPLLSAGHVLIRVAACAACRTDLHVIDGELTQPKLPLILGHEIVGRVESSAKVWTRFGLGNASGCRGSVGRVASAITAAPAARISATARDSPVIQSTAALRNSLWQMRGSAFGFRRATTT